MIGNVSRLHARVLWTRETASRGYLAVERTRLIDSPLRTAKNLFFSQRCSSGDRLATLRTEFPARGHCVAALRTRGCDQRGGALLAKAGARHVHGSACRAGDGAGAPTSGCPGRHAPSSVGTMMAATVVATLMSATVMSAEQFFQNAHDFPFVVKHKYNRKTVTVVTDEPTSGTSRPCSSVE